MTGEKINSLVGDLVEMAQAFQQRPELERQITRHELEIDRINRDNQALRDSNDILRQHITELESKIVEVTKERDDAGFRCLEADDKAARVLDLARTLASGLGQVIAEVEPPKPQEPVVEQPKTEPDPYNNPEDRHPMFPEQGYYSPPKAEPVSVQADPTTENTASGASQESSDSKFPVPTASPTENATSNEVSVTGQSEPGPTSVTIQDGASAIDASPVPEVVPASQPDKPYAGKRLSELHDNNYITRDAWYAGGGDYEGWWS